MPNIIINEKGFVINVNNMEIRTPCSFKINSDRLELIMSQIKDKSITDFSIINDKRILVQSSNNLKLNYKQDQKDDRDFLIKNASKINVSESILKINSNIDYTSQMTPVKNQGSLGSCVAFAVAAMKEWQEEREHMKEIIDGKKYKRSEKCFDYSEQWIYYKCKEIDPWPNEEGTSLRFAMKVLNKIGVPCEKAWKYNDTEIGNPKSWAKMVSLWALGGSYYRVETPEDLIATLRSNGPTPIGIICFKEIFYASKNGIVNYPAQPDYYYGGHAVCIVGFNVQTRMFKFKNSWGLGWGDNGYGYVSYKYLKDFMMDSWAIEDIQVTRDMLKEKKSLI